MKKLNIETVLLFIWHTTLFFILGAVFNVFIAFSSLWFKELQMITAALTGYGIYKLFQKGKNDSV